MKSNAEKLQKFIDDSPPLSGHSRSLEECQAFFERLDKPELDPTHRKILLKAEDLLVRIIEAATGTNADGLLQGLFIDEEMPAVNFANIPADKVDDLRMDLGRYACQQGVQVTRVGILKGSTINAK